MLKPNRAELIILLLIAAALLIWILIPRPSGSTVQVTVDGSLLLTAPLHTDAQIPIAGTSGFSTVLIIENGKARVESSTCPDLICQHHAPISTAGDPIVCLPGKIVISVQNESEEEGFDAVAK